MKIIFLCETIFSKNEIILKIINIFYHIILNIEIKYRPKYAILISQSICTLIDKLTLIQIFISIKYSKNYLI